MFGRGAAKEDDGPKAFVDLGECNVVREDTGHARVIAAELLTYDDFKPLLDMAYKGNTVIIDLSRFTSGPELRNKVAVAMTDAARDVGGRVMSLSDRTIVFTPKGVRLDMFRNRR